MNLELRCHFIQCLCGRDLRFDFLNQVRNCSCGRKVSFSENAKRRLIAEHEERTKRLASIQPQLTQRTKLTFEHGAESITWERLKAPEAGEEKLLLLAADEVYAVRIEGGAFSYGLIGKEVMNAFSKFVRTHMERLWELN